MENVVEIAILYHDVLSKHFKTVAVVVTEFAVTIIIL